MEPMSQDGKAERPGQATFAGWLIIVGSVIVIGTAWSRISELNTLEAQEELRQILSEPPLEGTGLGIGELSATVRVLCMIAAGAATAAAILGFQALRRSRTARVVLTALAPLMLIGGFATAGFFAPLVVAGIVMLWLSPSRDWFAGRSWSAAGRSAARGPDPFAPSQTSTPSDEPQRTHQTVPGASDAQPPPSSQVFGAPPPGDPTRTTQPVPPDWQASYGAPQRPSRGRRPGALAWACGITWLMCGVLSGLMLLFSFVFLVAREEMFAEIERQQPGFDYQGLTQDEVVLGIYAMTAFVVAWCVAATIFAIFAFRGANWGRIALLASAASAGMVCLAMSLASPALLLVVVVTAVTVWLLFRSDVVAWYRR
jgi:hypothetical protein